MSLQEIREVLVLFYTSSVAGLASAEGAARAVKPWSSFQCTGIHHVVWARTYKGDEHLAYALKVFLNFPRVCMGTKNMHTAQSFPGMS